MYEKYGYEFYRIEKDIEGEDSRVYRKALAVEGPDKDRRNENGTKWKNEIIKKAREGVDMIAALRGFISLIMMEPMLVRHKPCL